MLFHIYSSRKAMNDVDMYADVLQLSQPLQKFYATAFQSLTLLLDFDQPII